MTPIEWTAIALFLFLTALGVWRGSLPTLLVIPISIAGGFLSVWTMPYLLWALAILNRNDILTNLLIVFPFGVALLLLVDGNARRVLLPSGDPSAWKTFGEERPGILCRLLPTLGGETEKRRRRGLRIRTLEMGLLSAGLLVLAGARTGLLWAVPAGFLLASLWSLRRVKGSGATTTRVVAGHWLIWSYLFRSLPPLGLIALNRKLGGGPNGFGANLCIASILILTLEAIESRLIHGIGRNLRKNDTFRRWDHRIGFLVGLIKGLVLAVIFVFVAESLLDSRRMEELFPEQPEVAEQVAATRAESRLLRFASPRNPLPRLGDLEKLTNVIVALQDEKKRAILEEDEDFQALKNDPDLAELLHDEDFWREVGRGNVFEILLKPALRHLLKNEELLEHLRAIEIPEDS